MKYLSTYSLLFFSTILMAQEKPVTISQQQVGNQIILTARNNAEYNMKFTLEITSQGLTFNRDIPVIGRVNIGEEKEVLTMTAIKGQQASFKYKLKPEALGVEEEVISQEVKPRSFKAVVANSAKHHAAKARRNVYSKIDTSLVTIFTKIDCEECDTALEFLIKNDIKYKEYEASFSISNEQLMWDVLYVYGKKEGKVKLPIFASRKQIFYNIADLSYFLRDNMNK